MFSFVERDPLTDEVLEHSVDLATVIKKTSAEEMEQILAGKLVADKKESAAEEKKSDAFDGLAKANIEDYDEPKSETSSLAESALDAAKGESNAGPSFNDMKPACKCPFGHTWGEADKHDECKKCNDLWEKCFDASSN